MGIESLRSATALSEATLRAIAADDPGDVVLPLEELAPDRWFAWTDPRDGVVKQRTLLQIAAHHGAAETVAALLRIPGARRGLALASPTDGTTALDAAADNPQPSTGRILAMLDRSGTPMEHPRDDLGAHQPSEVRIRPPEALAPPAAGARVRGPLGTGLLRAPRPSPSTPAARGEGAAPRKA